MTPYWRTFWIGMAITALVAITLATTYILAIRRLQL